MKKIIAFVVAFMLVTTSAHAHIINRDNLYSDLSLTIAADDIVLLAALHVIQSDYGAFEPTKPLTMKQLAEWVAGYYSLADAQAAVDAGFVASLDGDATYEAVNAAYFNSALQLTDTQQGTLTREQFATFVAAYVNTPVNGQTMIEAANFMEGPTGVIEAVTVENGANVLTISGTPYMLGHHPSAIAASADPAVWIGETVAESYIGPNGESDYAKNGEETALQFIVLGQERYTAAPIVAEEPAVTMEEALQEVAVEAAPETQQEERSQSWLYVVGGLILAVVVVTLLWRKQQV